MTIKAMKQALEAFEDIASWYGHDRSVGSLADSMYEAKCLATVQATSLRQAIEQAEKWVKVECPLCGEMAVAHTHPSLKKREWVGLTDDEIDKTEWVPLPKTQITLDIGWIDNMKVFARAIEAKLKEKNT